MSSHKLAELKESLAEKKTKAFLVIRNDKIVYEWYAPGHSATNRHSTASMAKAIVGGLALGVAVSDGRISLDDKAATFIPQWRDHPMKSRITIRHLGSHTSGIQDAWDKQLAATGADHEKFPGWEGDFWRWRSRAAGKPNDAFTLSRDVAPVLFEPGTAWAYSNPGIALMDYTVTAALKDALEIRTLLRDRIMRPIGVADGDWSCGYGKTETVDGLPLVGSWGGGSFTARATARIGRLMLREGNWEGRQLLSAEAVRQITSDAGMPGPNGMGWWSNADGRTLHLVFSGDDYFSVRQATLPNRANRSMNPPNARAFHA
ncbi:MAG: beta-lactamase family protein [Verrucomicrobiales bacterium]|nr:beta-lactamase family protein [Verrucomicrobiales bacterium]